MDLRLESEKLVGFALEHEERVTHFCLFPNAGNRKTEGSTRMARHSTRQNIALNYIRQHGRITRSQYQEISGLPLHRAKRELARMVKAGLIIRYGSGRSYWYELRDRGGAPRSVPQDPTENRS